MAIPCSDIMDYASTLVSCCCCPCLIAQYMTGYDAAKPAGSIIPIPVQNNVSVNAACINPGINNANETSAVSIAAILTVSPITVTFAACFNDIVLSMGIIVNA